MPKPSFRVVVGGTVAGSAGEMPQRSRHSGNVAGGDGRCGGGGGGRALDSLRVHGGRAGRVAIPFFGKAGSEGIG